MIAAAEPVVEPALAERLDGYVLRAQTAARAFRPLGQEEVGMPRSLEAAGVARADFESALPELARAAFEDPSIRTNPRIPLVHELTQLLEEGFHGR